jgi:hypothetical protein
MTPRPADFDRLKQAKLAFLHAVRARASAEGHGSARDRLLIEIDDLVRRVQALAFKRVFLVPAVVPLAIALDPATHGIRNWEDIRISALEEEFFPDLNHPYYEWATKVEEEIGGGGADPGCTSCGDEECCGECTATEEELEILGEPDYAAPQPRPESASFAFHPDLFELRTELLAFLGERGFTWLTDFKSVDPLHDCYGLEVGGIADRTTADAILRTLQRRFRNWHYRHWWCKGSNEVEPGWVVVLHRDPEPRSRSWSDGL